MIDPTIAVLEHMTHVAPLGLRFADLATGQLVGAGLQVLVAPANVVRVVEQIASVRELDVETVLDATFENALNAFPGLE